MRGINAMSNYPGLRAVQDDPEALRLFIRAEQKKRDDKAEQEWQQYALFCDLQHNFYSHIITPEGLRYRHETTVSGPARFVGPVCNTFIEAVNRTAERMGIAERLEGKHIKIAQNICDAVRRGRLAWVHSPACGNWPEGFVTVDPSKMPTGTHFYRSPRHNQFAVSAGIGRMGGMVGATEQGGR
jgi:hypothetical protein